MNTRIIHLVLNGQLRPIQIEAILQHGNYVNEDRRSWHTQTSIASAQKANKVHHFSILICQNLEAEIQRYVSLFNVLPPEKTIFNGHDVQDFEVLYVRYTHDKVQVYLKEIFLGIPIIHP